MRCLAIAAAAIAAACAGSPNMELQQPDWSGPPLAVTSRADGGLALELSAPTAGHAFQLRAIEVFDDRAEVRLLHRTPGSAIVAQVVTPLPIAVPAESLAGRRCVRLWVATQHGSDAPVSAPALAFVLLRP
ncbi:MAG: hypothetical protein JNL08_19530 [Planctomycetes bacterium]|nr:hypothetical protein [Planctomycetota bacterium]